jgi:N-methylhydantoinase B
MPPEVPANAGCIRPLKIIVPEGSLLNPQPPHAVAGGNVETSQRIVDVLLGALAKALPEYIPAGSYGTMNNLLVGGHHHGTDQNYVYYETIAGGMGARPTKDGVNGIQMHMTNTRNTPIEAIEMQFPFRLLRYSIRRESGGEGMYKGGYGLVREYLFMSPATVTVLSERRRFKPYGLNGGQPGTAGKNILFKSGVEEVVLPPKITLDVEPGDILSIHTPGGGGWGQAPT